MLIISERFLLFWSGLISELESLFDYTTTAWWMNRFYASHDVSDIYL